ncbi:unnamed protein product [Fraxinus pennsylvanica]|uniref:Uncharacterized protein n=1 Tax=Fraxinus pennsylvanica TaxID=56036 RepID=A0AAD1YQQ2_9LAMI|nr:unnamed protein product [Fraxinus pennsylvanica]
MVTDRASKRDHCPQRKVHVPPQDDKKSCEVDRHHPDESVTESNMADDPNVGHYQGSFRERKPATQKGRPYSLTQVPVRVGESAPAAANTTGEHDRIFSSGFRQNRNQNNCSGRGHESHGDWPSVHDSRQHNVTAFHERQWQNVHYEYLPDGHYKNSKTDRLVGSGEGSNDVASRYRERNQSHTKHGGNSHRRQVDLKFQALGPTLVLESGVVSKDTESRARESTNMSRDLPLETPWTSHLEHISHGQSSHVKQDSYNASARNAFKSTEGSVSRHKQILYIQKHNDPSQKNLNEKSALIVTGEAQKDLTDVSVNNVTLMERRKSHRISKNKQRLDEAAVISPIPLVIREETNPAKEYIENGKSKASLSDLDGSVSAKIELDGGVQASEVQASHEEEAHSRVSKQWKPQSCGMPRSLQANRMVDKFHSNDALMWAPVHSQSKVEGAVEACQKSTPESATPVKIDNLVQNNSKGKRVEMERYVPKPVAKELAQQGSIQPVPFSASPAPEEAAGKALPDSARSANPPPTIYATGIVGSGVDVEEGDGTHNKQGKAHGTWRQRNFTEPSNEKSVHHGPSATSNPSKDI